MAKAPDGKPARVERVTFTRPAADRIGKAVRIVEAGNRDAPAIHTGPRLQNVAPPVVFRICTFTGAWNIASGPTDRKTVTFKYQTMTPNTVAATNLFAAVNTAAAAGNIDCAVAREGTSWFLIAAKCP